MPRKFDWFPFRPWAWLGSQRVQLMPPAARGCYATLLAQQWVTMESTEGGGLPNDVGALAALAGMATDPAGFTDLWEAHLDAMFDMYTDEEVWNGTLLEVWTEQHSRNANRQRWGKAGATARYGGSGTEPSAASLQMQTGNPSVANATRSDFDSVVVGERATPAHVIAQARDWLAAAPRKEADTVRAELRKRLPYPDDWDLRKLPSIAMGLRNTTLVDILTERGVLDGDDTTD